MQVSLDSSIIATREADQLDPTESLGRNDFLQLLVAKLENQDPLKPAEDTEFIAELATFSSLEQLIDVNDNLESLALSQAQMLNSQALDLVGKYAIVDGNEVRVQGGQAETLYYELPRVAKDAELVIYRGDTVYRRVDLGTVPDGRLAVPWDGKDANGLPLPDGSYSVRVEAVDLQERAMYVPLLRAIPIDGASFLDGAITLISGGRELSFDEILEIRDDAGQPGAPPQSSEVDPVPDEESRGGSRRDEAVPTEHLGFIAGPEPFGRP